MKRMIVCFLLIAMMLSMNAMALSVGDPVEIDVIAKVERGVLGEYTADIKSGAATVSAGTVTVTVQQAPAGAAELVVVPVPNREREAYNWFSARMAAVGVPFDAYDVYFRNAVGERIDSTGATVTLALGQGTEDVKCCGLTRTGNVSELAVIVQGRSASVMTNGSAYYVFARPAEEETNIRVEVAAFVAEDIPDELVNVGMDTVEKVEQHLTTSIQVVDESFDEENTVVYEAALMYSEDGGETWQTADEEHFPADGRLLVSLPVPEGTDPAIHDYTVVHMFSSDAFGKRAGDVEYPEVTKRTDANGNHFIDFYVTGLSPVMVGWTEVPAVHSFTNCASSVKATDATCTEAATYYVQCDICGEVSTTLTVAVGTALGHAYDNGVVTKEATCKAEGQRLYTCANDSAHTYIETIGKLKHTYRDGVCVHCGDRKVPITGDVAPWKIAGLFVVMIGSLTAAVKLGRMIKKKKD